MRFIQIRNLLDTWNIYGNRRGDIRSAPSKPTCRANGTCAKRAVSATATRQVKAAYDALLHLRAAAPTFPSLPGDKSRLRFPASTDENAKNGIPRIKIALPWRNSGARVPQISLRQETTRARRAEPGVRRESVQNSRLASRELPASAEAERARPPRTHTDEQSEANSRFARTAGEPPFASHVERSNDCRRQTQRKRPVAATYALSCERSTSKAPLGAHRIQ